MVADPVERGIFTRRMLSTEMAQRPRQTRVHEDVGMAPGLVHRVEPAGGALSGPYRHRHPFPTPEE
jgi:hypothetical protein